MNNRDCDDLVKGLFGPAVEAGAMLCVAEPEDLFAEERQAIVDAVAQRRNEFTAGRVCARRLLSRFGIDAVALPTAAGGAPHWPAGFVGSIAHSSGLCVVAVASRSVAAGIGIDVEAARGTDADTWDLLCTSRELDWLRGQRSLPQARLLATALFSAKESTYKSLHSQPAGAFEPRCIEVDWDGESTAFRARIVATPGLPLVAVQRPEGRSEPLFGTLIRRQGWILSGVLRDQGSPVDLLSRDEAGQLRR